MVKKRTLAVIRPDGQIEVRKEAIPALKANEVLVEVYASLISPGTEIGVAKAWRTSSDPKRKELRFGYSTAGKVIAVAPGVTKFKVGDRVATMGGGYALHSDYNCVPVNLLVPLPDNVSYEQGTFAHLGATALQAVRRTEPQLGEYGIVAGQGIVGNVAAQLCQLSGARVVAWEGMPFRIRLAKRCGVKNVVNVQKEKAVDVSKAAFAPYGGDFAIMAFGGNATAAFNDLKSCMKVSADGHEMGRIVLVGGCKIEVGGGAWSGNLDVRASSRTGAGYHDNAWEYGKDYPAAFIQFTTERNLREIIQLIAEKRLVIDPMITHHLPLAQTADAAELLIQHPDKAMGVILTMGR